jgi:23S rRNA (cytosine1962-C5)-methyltransferase
VDDLAALVRERIRAGIAYRERIVQNSNAYRVIFSEGDFLPGLIVDRYNDVLSFQVLTQAIDSEQMRGTFLSELESALKPAGIVERADPRVRTLEQLPDRSSGLVHGTKSQTEFQMNGLRFLYDALGGQKTGAFLDQRENYAAAAQYARGDALDVFCYQGGFAVHLARSCGKVTGVDSSRPALETADQNAALNKFEIEWIEANAFDLLRDYADTGRQYDTIVLDPPAFAKSRRDVPAALRAYKELNLRALKMLRPGGILVSCSCSFHVSRSDLQDVLASAALDSHRNIRILENRGQAKDHPIIPGIPETDYLKCLVVSL